MRKAEGPPTVRAIIPEVLRARERRNAVLKVLKSSSSYEWYTPERHLEAVRYALGGTIDLDPASSDGANKVVKAKRYLTIDDSTSSYDGSIPWIGNVFCNPPYCRLAGKFTTRALAEYEADRMKAGILCLSGYAYETKWFAPLWDHVLCFIRGRVHFRHPDGRSAASTVGTVYVYLGPSPKRFHKAFEPLGEVVERRVLRLAR
jgi:hypothetical protein